jgi:hypothetical protein
MTAPHVIVTVSVDSLGAARAEFGTILFLSYSAPFAERTRKYSSTLGVAADWPDPSSPERLAAAAVFSQTPRPREIVIGRGELPPTQVYVLTVEAVRNEHTYKVNVRGEGFVGGAAEFTSDASATNDEIVAGLVAALNAIADNNYTAAATGGAGSQVVTVTADAAGDWFALEVNPFDLRSEMTHADPGVATDLDAILLHDNGWYALGTFFNSSAYSVAAAAWTQGTGSKIYLPDFPETGAILDSVGTGDDGPKNLFSLGYSRTAATYHPRAWQMVNAAWMGRSLAIAAGGETWKFKRLAGVEPIAQMTDTHHDNLLARKCNWYEAVAGIPMMMNGTLVGGDFVYIDVVRALDWFVDDLSKSVLEAIAGPDRIPYTDPGIAVVEAAVRGSVLRAKRRGVLADDPEPQIEIPLVANVSTADKVARHLADVKVSGVIQGAIHSVAVTVSVTF